MIFVKRNNPKESLYYQATIFLSLIKEHQIYSHDLLGFFKLYENSGEEALLNFSRFMLLMDYLFLLKKVKLSENGEIEVCI